MHKSEELMQTCLANGWKAQVKPELAENPEEIVWNLYAIRNKETLHVPWLGNRMQAATYTYGEHHRLVLNWRNQVLKLVTGRPDPRKLKGEDTEKLIKTRSVPWDEESNDIEILLYFSGKAIEISWIRAIDREIATGVVDGSNKFLKVKESPPNSGRRVLEWADAYGFHAVRLDSIINVA